jgi:hypothetical protein
MAVAAYLDGADVTSLTVEGSVTHTLSGKSTAAIKIPLDVAPGGIYSSLYIDAGAVERNFFGRVMHVDEQGEETHPGYVVYTAVDPTQILEWRPARDADGDFSKPSFMTDFPRGPQMLEEILQNSITYEGDLGFSLGTFATGGVDLSGLPTDWPMSISEIVGLLVQTGEVDLQFTPSPTGGTLSVLNGDLGVDRSGSVSFKYAMGSASNCRACRRTIDASELMNKLWIYMGPRVKSKADPAGDQHWAGNITRDHPGLAGLPGFGTVSDLIDSSRGQFLQRMQIRILDVDYATAYQLYLHWWLRESLLRAQPKTLVHLTPERGVAPTFGVGDRIHVQAGTSFRGGFSGVQRVYSLTYRWDEDGVLELGEPVGQSTTPAILTSADQEVLA